MKCCKCKSCINWIALLLVIIGALNWGMWGFFQIDVVASIFGGPSSATSRVIFAIVGLAGIWSFRFFRAVCCCRCPSCRCVKCDCSSCGKDCNCATTGKCTCTNCNCNCCRKEK